MKVGTPGFEPHAALQHAQQRRSSCDAMRFGCQTRQECVEPELAGAPPTPRPVPPCTAGVQGRAAAAAACAAAPAATARAGCRRRPAGGVAGGRGVPTLLSGLRLQNFHAGPAVKSYGQPLQGRAARLACCLATSPHASLMTHTLPCWRSCSPGARPPRCANLVPYLGPPPPNLYQCPAQPRPPAFVFGHICPACAQPARAVCTTRQGSQTRQGPNHVIDEARAFLMQLLRPEAGRVRRWREFRPRTMLPGGQLLAPFIAAIHHHIPGRTVPDCRQAQPRFSPCGRSACWPATATPAPSCRCAAPRPQPHVPGCAWLAHAPVPLRQLSLSVVVCTVMRSRALPGALSCPRPSSLSRWILSASVMAWLAHLPATMPPSSMFC